MIFRPSEIRCERCDAAGLLAEAEKAAFLCDSFFAKLHVAAKHVYRRVL